MLGLIDVSGHMDSYNKMDHQVFFGCGYLEGTGNQTTSVHALPRSLIIPLMKRLAYLKSPPTSNSHHHPHQKAFIFCRQPDSKSSCPMESHWCLAIETLPINTPQPEHSLSSPPQTPIPPAAHNRHEVLIIIASNYSS
jgi:hypothetical protein